MIGGPSVETSLQALDRLYARSQSQAQKSARNPSVVAASVRVHRSRNLTQKQGHRLTGCECIGSTYALIWVPLQNRASKTQERHALYSQLTSCGPLVLSDCSGVRSNPIPNYTKKNSNAARCSETNTQTLPGGHWLACRAASLLIFLRSARTR